MQRKIRMAVLLWGLASGPAQAGNIGGYWTQWRTEDAGENDGIGFKITLTEQGAAGALEFRVARFSGLSAKGDPEALTVTPLELGPRFAISQDGPLELYAGIGAGYYLMDHEKMPVSDEFGFYGLLGGEFKLGQAFLLFAEIPYRRVRAEPPGRAPITLDGIGVNLGVGYRW